MNKRLAAGALAAACTASVMGVATATPAAAAQPCGTYPPGLSYVLVRAPQSARVRVNAIISTRGTLRRGGEPCVGYTLGFYVKPASVPYFRMYSRGVTSSTGSVHKYLAVKETTRFFYNLSSSARSGTTQFVVVS